MAGMSGHERPNKGATDIWLTPLHIIKSLGEFDLDPCGEAHWPTAKNIYTEKGLEQNWFGRVWLNPPYSEVGLWLDKLANHGYGVALVFARTDTTWAQRILPKATQVFFPKGRIKFHKKDGSNPSWTSGAPSMFIVFGDTINFHMEGWNVLSSPVFYHHLTGKKL
jgi:hypothetical protein